MIIMDVLFVVLIITNKVEKIYIYACVDILYNNNDKHK